MKQGVLLGAIRNCDGSINNTPHKILTRAIRAACIKSAQSSGSFLAQRPDIYTIFETACVFKKDGWMDSVPVHFLLHLIQAIQVLAYDHPDPNHRTIWLKIYTFLVYTK